MQKTLRGAKGGGASFTQKPDTLRSNDTFEGLLGLCAGPIKGPVNGLKSVRLDGTPIVDEGGTENFTGLTALVANGDPVNFPQIVSLKLGAGGSPLIVGVPITNINPSSPGDWVSRTSTNLGADALDLRFVVNQLYHQTKSGIFEQTLTLEIEMKPTGSTTWINPFVNNSGSSYPAYDPDGFELSDAQGVKQHFAENFFNDITGGTGTVGGPNLSVKGKTTSPYVHELRIQVPNTGNYVSTGWDVRVRLIEKADISADPDFDKRDVAWESLTAVYHATLGDHEDWRGLAWLQIYGKATDNLNGVPEVDGIYDTKIVSVPNGTVYDPDTRIYSGATWDGSWASAYCRDPAWIINDAISDSISGIAAFSPGASLNKWDALELSKWASELVSDGNGGTHCRYTMGLVSDQAQKADEFIRFMAGAVGAAAWDQGDGEWRLRVDKPEVPVALFTLENIEGEFTYSHTDTDTRFNDVTVSFLNEEFDYREDHVRVLNQDDIDLRGRKPTKVVGVGCTNRQQALRMAVLRIRTNLNEWRLTSFTTNRQGKHLERFDQILVADGSLGYVPGESTRTTGRLLTNSGTTLTVRDPIRLEIGVAYTLYLTIPNPNYDPEPAGEPAHPEWAAPTTTISRTITNTSGQRGNVTTLYINTALPAGVVAPNAVIAIDATGLPALPRTYRVIDVDYADDGERVNVNALQIDTGKWDASDAATETALAWATGTATAPSPTEPDDGMFILDTFVTDFETKRALNIKWDRPGSLFIKGFQLRWRLNDSPWSAFIDTQDRSFTLQQPEPGLYDFEVYSVDRRGQQSRPLIGQYDFLDVVSFPPAALLTNESHTFATASDGTGGSFTGSGGSFVLINELGPITTGVVYSVVSASTGLTIAINSSTGVYLPSALTVDNGTATLRAVWQGFTIDKTYSIAKSKGGVDAKLLDLQASRQIISYDTGGSLAPSTQTTTFTVVPQHLSTSSFTVSMTKSDGTVINANTYLTTGGTLTASGNNGILTGALTFVLTAANFDTARGATAGVVLTVTHADGVSDAVTLVKAQDGAVGATGAAGLNNALVFIFKRAASAPTLPSVTTTYTFATGALASLNNGWTQTVPTVDGNPLYVSVATASSNTSTDTIGAGEWVTPTIQAQDGATGGTGAAGNSVATVYLYQRAASTPSVPAGTLTFTFATGVLASITGGWTQTIPAGANPLYVTTATALGSGATDTIGTGEWASPTVMAQDGATGATGTTGATGSTGSAGLSVAIVKIYKRAASGPALPTTTGTFTFATGAITGLDNGWTIAVPAADGNPLYVSVATASAAATTDTIAAGEWVTAVIEAQDGATGGTGATGAAGATAATVFLYKRAASAPSVPAGTLTYTFATSVLASITGGWTQTVPAGSDPLYITTATAYGTGSTDTILTSEWATPSIMAQDGATGATGVAGLHNALVMVFQRASGTPTLPSATTTYTFSTGVLTGLNNGWTQAVPTANGNPLYVTVATASANTSTDTIGSGEWAAAVIQSQDGATGATGSTGGTGAAGATAASVYLYQRAASAPAVPAGTLTYTFSTSILGSITGGWTQTVPAGSNPLYVTTATAFGTGSTDTIATGEWATPTIMAQDGATGATGAAGLNNQVVLLYQRGATAPALPSGSAATFTFATGVISGGTLNGWTTAIPASDGNPLWVTAQLASSNTSTASMPAASWAAAVQKDGAGLNTAPVYLYQRAGSSPAVPAGTLTYTFATAILASITGGWTQTVPTANGNPLYVTTAVALGTGLTDTILTGEWATVTIMSQDGATGATGAAGLNNAPVFLYQRGATAPALPSGSASTYTFATGVLSGGTMNGWTQAVPASDGNPLWVTVATASSNTSTDTIAAAEWAAAVQKDGAGLNTATVILFKRTTSVTPPAVPSGTLTYTFSTSVLASITNSWTQTVPADTDGAWFWVTTATALGAGATDTIATGEWATPRLVTDNVTLTTIAGVTDPNVLDRQEKNAKLLPTVAQLGARYTQLTARATALGVSFSAATTARSNYLTYLGAVSPTYDDTTQDTTLSVSAYGDFVFPATWSTTLTSQAASGIYYTLLDNTSGFLEIGRVKSSLTANQQYTAFLIVKKDAVAQGTRMPLMRFQTLNGTSINIDVFFATDTGNVIVVNNAGTADATGCLSLNDTEWLVYTTLTTAGGATSIYQDIYPAVGTNGGSTGAVTGSILARTAGIVVGTLDKVGREIMKYREKEYSNALDALAKSVSEADVVAAATSISGFADITIAYSADGTAKAGELTRNETMKLVRGGATVTTGLTWTYTVISGTINTFDNTSGAQSITGAGAVTFATSSLGTDEAKVQLKCVDANGVVFVMTVRVSKAVDLGGSGSGGGTFASGGVSFTTSSTSYGSAAVTLRCTAGSGGQVALATAGLSFVRDSAANTQRHAFGKWQWRVIGGSYADVTTEIKSSPGASNSSPEGILEQSPGAMACSMAKTGLTNGVQYEFCLLLRNETASVTLDFSGTGTATGS